MIFILTFILSMLILGVSFGIFNPKNYQITKETKREDYRGNIYTDTETVTNQKQFVKIAVVVIISFIFSTINPLTVERIDVGNMGLKINNTGEERGISKTTYVTG